MLYHIWPAKTFANDFLNETCTSQLNFALLVEQLFQKRGTYLLSEYWIINVFAKRI